MPQLPVYNSKENLNANTAGPLRDEAAQPFKDDQTVIKALGDATQKWSDANDVMQYTEAKAKHGLAVADIEARANADPDFKNSERYTKELISARKNATAGITNQQVAGKAGAEFDYDSKLAEIKIGAQFRKKQIDYNQVMVETNLDTLMQSKLSAQTEAESQQYDLKIQSLLHENIQTGTLSYSKAAELFKESQKKAAEGLVYSSPEFAIQKLKTENIGLDEATKGKLIDEAGQVIKKRDALAEWQDKQNQVKATIDLSDALSNNTLNPLMVRNMQQKGLVNPETAAIFDSIALKKKYEIPDSTALAEPDYFLRLIEDSMGDRSQIHKVMGDAAQAYADHKIGTNQYLYFVQNSKETFDRQSKGQFTKSSGQNKFMAAIDGIKEFFSGMGKDKDKEFKTAVGEFTDRVKPGEDPQKIKDEVINQFRIKAKPQIGNFPENGKVMVDKNGNMARVFADGRIEELK